MFQLQNVDSDGDHIRRVLVTVDRHQPAERFLPADGHVATLLSVLLPGARRGHELHVLQPVPVRLAERKLPEGVQAGVAVLAQRFGVRRGGRGRGPGAQGPRGRLPVREDVQRERHVPGDAVAHIRRVAVGTDHSHHGLYRTRSRRECYLITFYCHYETNAHNVVQ